MLNSKSSYWLPTIANEEDLLKSFELNEDAKAFLADY